MTRADGRDAGMFRSYVCESDDPSGRETVDAVDERTAAMGYRDIVITEHRRAPGVVRVLRASGGPLHTFHFKENWS